jgi:hypothetical protein
MPGERPPTDPGEVLRGRIRRTVEDAVGGAPGGDPDPAVFGRVLRLERMLEAYERTRPEPKRRLWPVIGLISGIAVALWLLLVLRVPSTDVSLALDLSSVMFQVGTETPGPTGSTENIDLVDTTSVDAVVFASFGGIEIDEQPVEAPPVKLESGPAHDIVLHPLAVPAGTRVRIRSGDRGDGVTVELEHPTHALELAVTVPTGNVPPGHPLAEALDASLNTRELVLWAEPDAAQGRCAHLAFSVRRGGNAGQAPTETLDARAIALAREIPVGVIRFTDIEDRARRRKQFSTVQGGTAFREELANREVELRPGEFLDVRFAPRDAGSGLAGWLGGVARAFGAAPAGADAEGGDEECSGGISAGMIAPASGTISRLSVGPRGIDLEARGRVAHLSIGTLDSRRDLMPRRLEHLQAGELLPLFWGAFLSVFGVCYTVFLYLRGAR